MLRIDPGPCTHQANLLSTGLHPPNPTFILFYVLNKRDQKVYSKASPWRRMGWGVLRRGTRIQVLFYCVVFVVV